MSAIFNEVLYRPILNLLIFLYNIIPGQDFGIAIILLTILIKVVFLPLSLKTLRSQKQMQDIQPKIKELQEKHKDDKQAQGQAVMQLYKENNVNPLSGCLPLLVQIPILLAFYRVLMNGFKPETLDLLYSFVARPETMNTITLNFLDLSLKNPALALITGGLQFIQMRKTSRKTAGAGNDQAAMMTKQMMYFFPIMIVVIAWNLPAGLVLYWTTNTIFSIFEQTLVFKDVGK
jgi:YidC/Oxa1 family membrane protein insertase